MDESVFTSWTNELRQVKHTKPSTDIMSAIAGKVDEWYTVQRKCLMFDGVSIDVKKHFMGSMDGTMINNVKGRPVWRDLPVVTQEEAKKDSIT